MQIKFPFDFKFGVADSDLQVIGEDFTKQYEASEPTMWDYFASASGKCYQNQTPGRGIDRYHKWWEDIAIMKEMGIRHYRTSVSMSRILKRNGEINGKAINWYSSYFKALQRARITIYVTLYHWELPQYLNEQGGWKNRKTIDYLVRHAEAVVNNLGEYIDEYFILNEPWCSSMLGYYYGIHAPGETNLKSALQAAHNLLLAQGITCHSLCSISSNLKISTVINVEPAYPYTQSTQDLLAAKYANGHFNRWFLDPIYLGEYPNFMIKLYGRNVPRISKDDMSLIKIGNKLHTLGINYYKGKLVKFSKDSLLKYKQVVKKNSLRNDLGWLIFMPPIYPEGLHEILYQIYHLYENYGLKAIYVTENGIALNTPWGSRSQVVNDDRRILYLTEHLRQVHKSIANGVPVTAYFVWTLMDNYEWAEGYRIEASFGLIHVDRKTMRRIWKKSAKWYQEVMINQNELVLR